jgi:hypothetical protein
VAGLSPSSASISWGFALSLALCSVLKRTQWEQDTMWSLDWGQLHAWRQQSWLLWDLPLGWGAVFLPLLFGSWGFTLSHSTLEGLLNHGSICLCYFPPWSRTSARITTRGYLKDLTPERSYCKQKTLILWIRNCPAHKTLIFFLKPQNTSRLMSSFLGAFFCFGSYYFVIYF